MTASSANGEDRNCWN